MSLTVSHLSHIYNRGMPTETAALSDVSFSAEPGELISIVGHTGCGKSTLAQHLNALFVPQTGEVVVDGIRAGSDNADLRKIREKVGLVMQYPEQQIFAETVEEEIAFGPLNWGVGAEEIEKRVTGAMNAMGLDPSLRRSSPFDLSGGQKRRVAIASVLASDPSYIVLDEPTAGLDADGIRELIRLLRARLEAGKCAVHITHDIELALKISTRILILNAGSVVSWGTPEETAVALCRSDIGGMALPDVLALSLELRNAGLIRGLAWEPRVLADMIEEAR